MAQFGPPARFSAKFHSIHPEIPALRPPRRSWRYACALGQSPSFGPCCDRGMLRVRIRVRVRVRVRVWIRVRVKVRPCVAHGPRCRPFS